MCVDIYEIKKIVNRRSVLYGIAIGGLIFVVKNLSDEIYELKKKVNDLDRDLDDTIEMIDNFIDDDESEDEGCVK